MANFTLKYPQTVRFTTYPDCDICGYPIVTDSAVQKRHDLCQRLYRREWSKHNQRIITMCYKEGRERNDEDRDRVKLLALHYSRKEATKNDGIQARSQEHMEIVREEEAILKNNPPQPLHVDDGSEKEHWSQQAKRLLDEQPSEQDTENEYKRAKQAIAEQDD